MDASWRSGLALLVVVLSGGFGATDGRADGHPAGDAHLSQDARTAQVTPLDACQGETAEDEEADVAEQKRKQYIQGVLSKSSGTKLQGKRLSRTGSGFFVAEDGLLATNYRLVDGCALISVSPTFGDMALAVPIAFESTADLALLRADLVPPGIAFFTGSEGALKREPTYVFGYPGLGLATTEPTLTLVEVLGSQKTVSSLPNIVIKGAILSGYNGGPLLDSSGGVIGAVLPNATQTYAATGGDVDAVGLALPSEAVRAFLDEHGIEHRLGLELPPKAPDRLRIDARPFMAQVGCWQ